jgi:peptide/nickel transport system substrate-binding protein
MLPKHWMEANNSAAPVIIGQGENFALRNAMGTGAFKLASREADRKNVLVKNPAWWDKVEHNLDRVEFTVISSAATRVAALLSGEMDMIYSVPPQDIDRIRQAPGIKIIQGPELRTIYLGMDQARDELLFSNVKGKNPFKDLRVRQAFALAIDEEAIVSRVMRGQGRATWMMWGPGVNGYNAELDKRPKVDIAKAKALLAEAGYPNGFGLTLHSSADRLPQDGAVAQAIGQMLRRGGITINAVVAEPYAVFAPAASRQAYSLFLFSFGTTSSSSADGLTSVLATYNPTLSLGAFNRARYSNPTFDRTLAEALSDFDEPARNTKLADATTIAMNDTAIIPLYWQIIHWAARKPITYQPRRDEATAARYAR